jgi:hypothetical protein
MEDDNQLPPWLAGNPVLDAGDDEENRPTPRPAYRSTPGHLRADGRTVRSSTDANSSIPDEGLCHKLTAFVFAADPKSQKNGSRGGSCFCSDECRRQDKIERRRARAQKYCRLCHRGLPRKRHPRPPDPLLPSKLPTVRRAHTPLS